MGLSLDCSKRTATQQHPTRNWGGAVLHNSRSSLWATYLSALPRSRREKSERIVMALGVSYMT